MSVHASPVGCTRQRRLKGLAFAFNVHSSRPRRGYRKKVANPPARIPTCFCSRTAGPMDIVQRLFLRGINARGCLHLRSTRSLCSSHIKRKKFDTRDCASATIEGEREKERRAPGNRYTYVRLRVIRCHARRALRGPFAYTAGESSGESR